MYVFFRALLTAKCSTFFSDQKYVRAFPWKAFNLKTFYFQVFLFSTLKRLTKSVDDLFK